MSNKTSLLLAGLPVALSLMMSPASAAATESNASEQKAPATTNSGTAINQEAAKPASEKRSPWLFVPLLSSSPKLDTAAGGMVGYLHTFDEKSRPSLFAVSGKYSTSESPVLSAFAKTSFDGDRQRILAGFSGANINNDYANFMDKGPAQTNDSYRFAFFRYLYRVDGDWFVGGQGSYSNYELSGQDAHSSQILEDAGLTGFKSGGVGVVAMHDSRDSDFMATKGWYLNINNLAYRESLGGDQDFEIYRTDYRAYWSHGDGNVLAVRQRNQFSNNAPTGSYSAIYLRGYTPGENLGQHMSSVEIEERYKIADRWTATMFAGVACLYGDAINGEKLNCGDKENVYPAVGAGVQYIIKPEAGIVANLEVAKGKDDNAGIYLKMGYSF